MQKDPIVSETYLKQSQSLLKWPDTSILEYQVLRPQSFYYIFSVMDLQSSLNSWSRERSVNGEHESTINLFKSEAQVPTAVLEFAASVLFSKIDHCS